VVVVVVVVLVVGWGFVGEDAVDVDDEVVLVVVVLRLGVAKPAEVVGGVEVMSAVVAWEGGADVFALMTLF